MAGYKVLVRTGFGEQKLHYEWFSEVMTLLGDMLRGTDEIDLKIIKESEEDE